MAPDVALGDAATRGCVIPSLIREEINDVTAMCRLIHDLATPIEDQPASSPAPSRHGNNDRFNRRNR